MVSDEHKRRVLANLKRQGRLADAHQEKPMVFFGTEAVVTEDHVDKQDGGQALIVELELTGLGEETGMFVRIQSWDPEGKHEDIKKLFGRKVEVMIRTLDK